MEALCSFCGLALESDAPGALWMKIYSERKEGSQQLVVHFACVAERLHPQVPFEAFIFETDDFE